MKLLPSAWIARLVHEREAPLNKRGVYPLYCCTGDVIVLAPGRHVFVHHSGEFRNALDVVRYAVATGQMKGKIRDDGKDKAGA
jgi:hypothetical protein